LSHSKDKKGNSGFRGEGGRKEINVNAPTVIRGAVSPIARLKAIITPDRKSVV